MSALFTLLIVALFAVATLSAQTFKVGDLYDVDGKRGVVFDVSEDGTHGTIIALTQPEGIMTWYKAMEWGKQLKDGWYIPSHKELLVLLELPIKLLIDAISMHSFHLTVRS